MGFSNDPDDYVSPPAHHFVTARTFGPLTIRVGWVVGERHSVEYVIASIPLTHFDPASRLPDGSDTVRTNPTSSRREDYEVRFLRLETACQAAGVTTEEVLAGLDLPYAKFPGIPPAPSYGYFPPEWSYPFRLRTS